MATTVRLDALQAEMTTLSSNFDDLSADQASVAAKAEDAQTHLESLEATLATVQTELIALRNEVAKAPRSSSAPPSSHGYDATDPGFNRPPRDNVAVINASEPMTIEGLHAWWSIYRSENALAITPHFELLGKSGKSALVTFGHDVTSTGKASQFLGSAKNDRGQYRELYLDNNMPFEEQKHRIYITPDSNPKQRRFRYLSKQLRLAMEAQLSERISVDKATGIFSAGDQEAIRMTFQSQRDTPKLSANRSFRGDLHFEAIELGFRRRTCSAVPAVWA